MALSGIMARLKVPLVSYLAGEGKGIVKSEKLFKWAREEREPPVHISRRLWKPLREGKPVPQELVEAFADYARTRKRPDGTPLFDLKLLSAVEIVPGAKMDKAGARVVDPWPGGWPGVLARVIAPFAPAGDDLCQDAEDVQLAASLLVEWVGRHTAEATGPRVDKAEARKIGEHEMQRTVGRWAKDWLLPVWKKCPSAILFSVVDGERVGTNILIPLAETAWQRFRAGQVWDADLTIDDIEAPSRYVLIMAVAEVHPSKFRSAAKAGWAQLIRFSWQTASLCPPVSKRGGQPILVGIAGTPESARRLEGFGFAPLGTEMPKTPRKLYECSPATSRRSFGGILNYQALCSLLGAFQAMQGTENREDEEE